MMPHEDIYFQLVDLPAVAREHAVPWLASALQMADACLLVVDLGEPDCVERIQALRALLGEKHVTLTERWEFPPAGGGDDPFAIRLPTLLLANKADLSADEDAELAVLRELSSLTYPALATSAQTGVGLDQIGPWLFAHLGVVRIYTKTPGKPAERDRPFTLRRGDTVADVARLVHADIARALKYARVWGRTGFGGQQVGRDHAVADGDVIELHT